MNVVDAGFWVGFAWLVAAVDVYEMIKGLRKFATAAANEREVCRASEKGRTCTCHTNNVLERFENGCYTRSDVCFLLSSMHLMMLMAFGIYMFAFLMNYIDYREFPPPYGLLAFAVPLATYIYSRRLCREIEIFQEEREKMGAVGTRYVTR